jgi:hypothetical protein
MWQDPIVTEVRQVRETHTAQYNYDLRAIYNALKEQEQRNPSPKVSFPPKLILPATSEVKPTVAA